jgi:hypothetical protein
MANSFYATTGGATSKGGSTNRRRRRGPALSLLLALVLTWAALGSAALASGHKTFFAEVEPHSVAAGLQEDFTATLVNRASQQQLGSANITAPTGFTLDAVDPQPLVNGTQQGTATIKNGVIELRNMSAPPGATITLGFKATPPCDAGEYTWTVIAKQSNNFQGPPGNNLDLAADSELSVTVTGDCDFALEFVDRGGPGDRQPKDAEKNTTITSEAFNPAGDPVQVEVIDGTGTRVTSWTGTVAIAIDNNPSGGTLSGASTTPQPLVDGVATFSDLKINLAGAGYTLKATSNGLASTTSDPFTIYDDVAICTEGEACETSAGNKKLDGMSVKASAIGGPGGGTLALALDIDVVDCGDDFSHFPKVVTLIDDGVTDKFAEVTIDKDQIDLAKGIAHYQVCAESDKPFIDRNGDLVTKGLLPNCDQPPPAVEEPPCVESKTKKQNGDGLIKIQLNPTWFR